MMCGFIVSGYAPAKGKKVNDLLSNCGLGVDGAFTHKSETLSLEVKETDVAKIQSVLERAYTEKRGWLRVTVTSV